MDGIIYGISKSTNTTVQSSGTTWSASILKGLMKANWENGNGEVATDVYMGAFLKDVTDSFTNKSTIVNTGVNVKEIIDVVDVLESGFGKVAIHKHRYIQQSSDATGRVLAIRPEKLKIAMLQAPQIDTDLARSGDYDRLLSSLSVMIGAKFSKFRENLRETMATLSKISLQLNYHQV
jgi:hypothetical protein